MDSLSDDMLVHLFTYFCADEAFKARLVCQKWHNLLAHRGVWLNRNFESCKCVDPCPGHQVVKSYVLKYVPCCKSIDMDYYDSVKYSSLAAQSICEVKVLKLEVDLANMADVTFILLHQIKVGYLQRLELQFLSYDPSDRHDLIPPLRMNHLMMTLLKLSYTCPEIKIVYRSCDMVPPLTVSSLSPDFSVDLDLQVHKMRKFSFVGWRGSNALVDLIIKCHHKSLQNVRLEWIDYPGYPNYTYDASMVATLLKTNVISRAGSPCKEIVIG